MFTRLRRKCLLRPLSVAAVTCIAALTFTTASAGALEPLTDLGTLGGTTSVGGKINANGTIVGASATTGGDTHAFSYDPATHTMTDLGTLGGTTSAATGINDAGVIVGGSDTTGGDTHTFSCDPGSHTMTDLDTLGGNNSIRDGINTDGTIVGEARHDRW